MGCLMSRKCDDANDVDSGAKSRERTTNDEIDARAQTKSQNCNCDNCDNCDSCASTTSNSEMNVVEQASISIKREINQANSGQVTELGHTAGGSGMSSKITAANCVCNEMSTTNSASKSTGKRNTTMATRQTRTKSSRRGRKRQKGVGIAASGGGAAGAAATTTTSCNNEFGNLGSFLSLFVQGRRRSGVRIDAGREIDTAAAAAASSDALLVQTSNRLGMVKRFSDQASQQQREVVQATALGASFETNESSPGANNMNAVLNSTDLCEQTSNKCSKITARVSCNDDCAGDDSNNDNSAHSNPEANNNTDDNDDTDEAILFANIQQLCCEIIGQKLLKNVRNRQQHHQNSQSSDTLCLFLFGRQGSSKGELSFELVAHSSLIEVLGDKSKLAKLLEQIGENANLAEQQQQQQKKNSVCPLYHHVDVSALIVANIDDRIREYNKLVARTLRIRRDQLALGACLTSEHDAHQVGGADKELLAAAAASCGSKQLTSFDEENRASSLESEDENNESSSAVSAINRQFANYDAESRRSSSENLSLLKTEFDNNQRELSIASQLSSGINSITTNASCSGSGSGSVNKEEEGAGGVNNKSQNINHQSEVQLAAARKPSIDYQFGIVTLTTKQRSILQLKLMKYAACVTSRWIAILINREINRVERQFKSLVSETLYGQIGVKLNSSSSSHLTPNRVYLINLVPNQLSLFKACLYLEQNLMLTDFHRPIWAVKFERRTNIRLLKKERPIELASQLCQTQRSSSFHFKLSQIRIPTILVPTMSSNGGGCVKPLIVTPQVRQDNDGASGEQAGVDSNCDNLAKMLNEKIGPKYNETFAQQFKAINRLTLLRYNPDDESRLVSVLTKDFNQMQQQQQQPQQQHHQLRPISRDGSSNCSPLSPTPLSYSDELDPIERAGTPHSFSSFGSTTIKPNSSSGAFSGAVSGTHHKLKWAIELELIDAAAAQQQQTSRTNSLTTDDNSSIGASGWLNRDHSATGHKPLFSTGAAATHDDATTASNGECLHTYHPPSRAHSRSPLMFGGGGGGVGGAASTPVSDERHFSLGGGGGGSGLTSQATGHYSLMATEIAYDTGKSQTILEVKRVYKRTFKCKTRSDLVKLNKLVSKVCQQLTSDLDSWLSSAILSDRMANHDNRGCGHNLQPLLVTYTIKVDLSRLTRITGKGQQQQRDASPETSWLFATIDGATPSINISSLHNNQVVPHLSVSEQQAHERGKLTPILRPSSAMDFGRQQKDGDHIAAAAGANPRAASSIGQYNYDHNEAAADAKHHLQPIVASKSNSSKARQASANKRHVQFRLDLANDHHHRHHQQQQRDQHTGLDCRPAQRRLWISDTLFVSCVDFKLFSLMSVFVDLLQAASNK